METSIPEVLCLYEFGPATLAKTRDGCGPKIFTVGGRLSEKFDDLQLYIEESLLFFVESRRVERLYGADFYGGLNYWRSDFSRDPTGAISYYIMSREVDEEGSLAAVNPQSVACLETMAGIEIDRMCNNYLQFLSLIGVPSTASDADACAHLNERQELRERAAENTRICRSMWWREQFASDYGE